ncbi:hypothetical protein [Haladaptatus sp. DFWS20]|uniref:hypothetical protein n=1 Tax=Haladaptatus sp. DFWS20 TaxID=3403467 RepID=UPI003EB85EE6
MKETLNQLLLGNGAIVLGLVGVTSANWSVLRYVLDSPSLLFRWGFLILVLLFFFGIVSIALGAVLLGRTAYQTLPTFA